MADATDEKTTQDSTTTDDTQAGAADKSTETTGKPKSGELAEDSAAADKGDDQDTNEDDSAGQGEDEDAGGSASEDEDDKSQSDDSKKRNREAAQLRIAQKNEKTTELRAKLQTDYVDQAENDTDREIREMKADRYVENVERVGRDLQRDNEAAAREIDLFNPNKPEVFKKDLLDRSLKRYARDCLTMDQNGMIIKYSIPLLDYMREEAEGYGYGSKSTTSKQQADKASKAKAKEDKAKQQVDKAKMDAAADATGGTSAAAAEAKKTATTDTFDEAFLAGMDDPYVAHKPKDAHTFATSSGN